MSHAGKQSKGLYVVATPIGNLGDLSSRACEVLRGVDVVAAEDTRRTRHLLDHFGIGTPTLSLHDHNEAGALPQLIARIERGESIALVSDAGTPLLSDPGFLLVRACHEKGYPVVAVPGPSAITAALSIAGVPANRFAFEGFLPPKQPARRVLLAALAHEPRTLVFFEVPHRIVASLSDIVFALGNKREIAVVREITKVHECVVTGSAEFVLRRIQSSTADQRGEFVVLVRGAERVSPEDAEIRRIMMLLLPELPLTRAAVLGAKITGCHRNQAYQIGLACKDAESEQGGGGGDPQS